MSSELSAMQRAKLAVLALTLIPESPIGPSAAEAQVAERWIDVSLDERPDLIVSVHRALDAYEGTDPRMYLEQLEREDPAVFAQFTYAIAASFFRAPEATAWLGSLQLRDEYEGAEPEPTATTERLLRPVREMPPLYRPTPPSEVSTP